jgi:hypothetical protein
VDYSPGRERGALSGKADGEKRCTKYSFGIQTVYCLRYSNLFRTYTFVDSNKYSFTGYFYIKDVRKIAGRTKFQHKFHKQEMVCEWRDR